MLKLLFSSEPRVKLLNLFLLHSDNRYSISQISEELKLTAIQANKEITNLIQFGLLTESFVAIDEDVSNSEDLNHETKNSKKGKNQAIKLKIKKSPRTPSKYYTVNKSFILYPEIKSLFIKSQILSSQNFILNLEKSFSIKLLLLTGFFTNYPEAQTDILIVGEIKRSAFLKLITDLEKDLGREINFTILDEQEFLYRKEIMDIFIHNTLEGKKIILIDNLINK